MTSLIDIPKICDPRGNLSFIENDTHLPFDIATVSWIYDMAAGGMCSIGDISADRRMLVALSGSFSAAGADRAELSAPDCGLLDKGGVYSNINRCSTNAVAMLLCESNAVGNGRGVAHSSMPACDSHASSTVDQCRIVELGRKRLPGCGSITTVNNATALFAVKRVYYLYDVPVDSERGGHSHHTEQRLIVAVAGCFDVTVSDGITSRTFTLNRPYRALYIPPGIWRTLDNFSSGSVCLALSSSKFSEADYVRDIDEFNRLTSCKSKIL